MKYRPVQEAHTKEWISMPTEAMRSSAFKKAKRLACKVEDTNFTNGEILRFLAEYYIRAVEPEYLK